MTSIWRFPGNNYTEDSGIDTPDMEMFAKEPISSLARELVQNSLDAHLDGKPPVRVEFKTFVMSKKEIPGFDDIANEIDYCLDYQTKNKKIHDELERMKKSISKNNVNCLRVSDFNTKGLCDVTNTEDGPFYLLTKGSGLSDKTGTMGGSKGIGKFASFVTSSINTVFYSTLNKDGEEGSIGICKLCSRRIKNSDEKTRGLGYYAIDKKNNPELKQNHLDKSFNRKEPGTDVYVTCFKKESNWQKEVVTKILDSFMCAIKKNVLSVTVEDIEINVDTLKDIVYSENLVSNKERNNIIAQYTLLSDDKCIHDEIEIEGYGTIDLFIKSYQRDESNLSTKRCVMVRYPYMKITSFPVSNIPCSALGIIRSDKLNETLRDIENPQHTDWECNRIDDPDERRSMRLLITQIKDKIKQAVFEHLQTGESKTADIEGAGDFLPLEKQGNNNEEEKIIDRESSKIVQERSNVQTSNSGNVKDDNNEFYAPDIGEITEDGDDSTASHERNGGGGGGNHPLDETAGHKEGDDEIMTLKHLTGLKYKLLAPNIKKGEIIICFDSIYNEKNCELEIFYLDDSGEKYSPEISKCLINGTEYVIEDNRVKGIKLSDNEKYKVYLYTNLNEYYSCEVKMYANKK